MLPAVYYTQDVSKTRTGEDPLAYLTNAVHDLIDLGKSLGLLFRQLGRLDTVTGIAVRTLTILKAAEEAEQNERKGKSIYSNIGEKGGTERAANIISVEEKKWDGGFSIEALHLPEPRFTRGTRTIDNKDEAVKEESVPILLKNLSITVKRGYRVLVRGENGAGKTTLLRLLTGRCKTLALNGTVYIPPPSKCAFLPARNYFPPHATLPQILSYPNEEGWIALINMSCLTSTIQKGTYTKEEMMQALKAVGLSGRLGDILNEVVVKGC